MGPSVTLSLKSYGSESERHSCYVRLEQEGRPQGVFKFLIQTKIENGSENIVDFSTLRRFYHYCRSSSFPSASFEAELQMD